MSGWFGAVRRPAAVPLRHTVCRRLVPGSGPRSRSSTSGATRERAAWPRSASGAAAGRLTNWLASAPSLKVLANAFRSSSGEASGCRSSASSTSGMMRPDPDDRADAEGQEGHRHGQAQGQVGPQHRVDRVDLEADVGGDEADARRASDRMNSAATTFSAALGRPGRPGRRAARRGRRGARRCPARAVAQHRRVPRPAAACRSPGAGPPWPGRRPRPARRPSAMAASPALASRRFAVIHRARQHQDADSAEEADEALGDRADAAQAEPARVGLGAGLGDVGDDVPLLARGDAWCR